MLAVGSRRAANVVSGGAFASLRIRRSSSVPETMKVSELDTYIEQRIGVNPRAAAPATDCVGKDPHDMIKHASILATERRQTLRLHRKDRCSSCRTRSSP